MKREIKNRLEFFDGKWKELSYIAVLNLLYFTLPLGVSIYSIVYESGMFCYYSIFLTLHIFGRKILINASMVSLGSHLNAMQPVS